MNEYYPVCFIAESQCERLQLEIETKIAELIAHYFVNSCLKITATSFNDDINISEDSHFYKYQNHPFCLVDIPSNETMQAMTKYTQSSELTTFLINQFLQQLLLIINPNQKPLFKKTPSQNIKARFADEKIKLTIHTPKPITLILFKTCFQVFLSSKQNKKTVKLQNIDDILEDKKITLQANLKPQTINLPLLKQLKIGNVLECKHLIHESIVMQNKDIFFSGHLIKQGKQKAVQLIKHEFISRTTSNNRRIK